MKYERWLRHWSQGRVGVVAKMPQPTVAIIENGRLIPSRAQLERLAAVFNLPADQLLDQIEVNDPPTAALTEVGRRRMRVLELEAEAAQ